MTRLLLQILAIILAALGIHGRIYSCPPGKQPGAECQLIKIPSQPTSRRLRFSQLSYSQPKTKQRPQT